jgi:hypothetical protein
MGQKMKDVLLLLAVEVSGLAIVFRSAGLLIVHPTIRVHERHRWDRVIA